MSYTKESLQRPSTTTPTLGQTPATIELFEHRNVDYSEEPPGPQIGASALDTELTGV